MNTPIQDGNRVVFVNRYFHPDNSATSQLLTDLANGLAQLHMNICVVTSRQMYQDPRAGLKHLQNSEGVTIHRLWSTRFGRMTLTGRMLDYISLHLNVLLWVLLKGRKTDVIVYMTDPPMLSLIGLIVGRIRGLRYVNWLQDIFPDTATVLRISRGRRVTRLLEVLRDRSIRFAETNIVIGQRMAERVRGHVKDAKTQIIHNWAPGDSVHPVPHAANHLRRDWQLADHFVVGYSGNMGRAHEFQTILDAAERLRTCAIVFLFIGDGAQKSMIESEAASRGLAKFMFKPYQPRNTLSESLSVPDAHFVSLRADLEGSIVPSKFYGVAAAGRPTIFIGDSAGEIAQIVTRHNCGIVVAPGNGAMLAECIANLAANRTLCAAMGRSARNLYENEFSLMRALQAWKTCLGTLQ